MSSFFGIAREEGHPLEEKFLEKLAEQASGRAEE
jgi:hypothetical protein